MSQNKTCVTFLQSFAIAPKFVSFDEMTLEEKLKRVDRVLTMIMEGHKLSDALKDNGISRQVYYDLTFKIPSLNERYMRCAEIRAHNHADDIVSIADEDPDPQRARNRIDARKWIASKLMPKQYGDRLDVNVTQTVDINAALSDAMTRAKLIPSQVIDNKQLIEHRATDSESVAHTEDSASVKTLENLSDDIFK